MRFEVGQQVGDYEFLEVVESAATGITYRVRNALADRQELLKVLSRDLQEDPEHVERFLREAKIHARLHHPNIASFYTATRLNEELVMTSELVEGSSLEQQIASGSLSLEQATKYFEQALAALSYAHQEGVVHRDITPRHLMITPAGNVKVTGFGLAKKPADPQLTQPGIVMGSMHYMSPEQVKGSRELDRRSDIYSLGVVLYEAVTGKKPFDAKSDFEVFMAHVNEEPPPPSSVRAGVPPEFDQIIRTAMAKQPADRFQTAEDFRGSLSKLQTVVSQSAAEAAQQPAVTDPVGHASAASETKTTSTPTESTLQPAAEEYPDFGRSAASDPPLAESSFRGDRPEFGAEAASSGQKLADIVEPPASKPPAEHAPAAANAERRDNPWPNDEAEESAKNVPLLLRSNDETPAAPARPVASPQRREAPAEAWLGDQTFAGWTTKDILAVGALTFVIVAAVFFAMLTLLNR